MSPTSNIKEVRRGYLGRYSNSVNKLFTDPEQVRERGSAATVDISARRFHAFSQALARDVNDGLDG